MSAVRNIVRHSFTINLVRAVFFRDVPIRNQSICDVRRQKVHFRTLMSDDQICMCSHAYIAVTSQVCFTRPQSDIYRTTKYVWLAY